MSLIKVNSVNKIYNDNGIPVQALKNISLEINKGDFMVLAGPSGSGKTTLLNLIGALDFPTSGEIVFNNNNLSKKSKAELSELRLKKMGFIFQAYNLIPVLTAAENIEFSLMLLGIPEKERRNRTLNLLDELGIKNLANKMPNEMSGGQQQRVAVARAIINTPEIVLADEPTANLDSTTGSNLLNLMQKMNEEKNITFIFSSHDTQVIQRAKKLVVLKDGEIYEN